MNYRKKPVVIQAVQFTGSNFTECAAFLGWGDDVLCNPDLHETDAPVIQTLEGVMVASPGDWIIRGVAGEHYPCKDAIFRATYEPA